jgi:hypothetical protein
MVMSLLLKTSILVLLISSFCFSQDPVPVLSARWHRTVLPAPKGAVTPTGPAIPVIPENKYFQRKAREERTDHPLDPTEGTIEGRSRAIDKVVQESRTPKADDIIGYSYVAEVRNDTGKTAVVIFLEYIFTEIERPANIVRRQFLCGVKLKDGGKRELPAFSLLGPSDAIDAASLGKSADKLFNEKVLVNRIEFLDGSILQRHNWKYADVKAGVERATSTPWGNEICRGL